MLTVGTHPQKWAMIFEIVLNLIVGLVRMCSECADGRVDGLDDGIRMRRENKV